MLTTHHSYRDYIFVIAYQAVNPAYTVDFLDIPEIITSGDTLPQAFANACGIINTLICGGAIIPLIMGKIADVSGYSWAFIVPAICYLYIFFYAVKGSKLRSA